MRAVVLQPGHRIGVADVPDAGLAQPTDVVVRVSLAAICGSDVHIKRGGIPGIEPGEILGHEFVGVVHKTGAEVRRFRVGDRVASPPALWCGVCPACQLSTVQNCVEMSMYGGGPFLSPMGLSGVQTELVRVANADLVLTRIPAHVPDEQAVLVIDMFSTGYHAANEAKIKVADSVAVSGCGPVGLCAILASWQHGASRVFAIDQFANRLGLAERYGAIPVNLSHEDPVETVMEATGGEGVDVVLEASGSTSGLLNATRMIKKYGTVSCVGLFGQPVEFPVHQLIYRGIRLTMGLGNLVHVPKLMKLVEHGRVDLSALGTHTFPLEDAVAAYDLFENHKDECLKVFLRP
ncbi:MAG: alcohol dehydrogenase catalytic domain-containing protein [Actinobacteria bacterium]|nr:alcohol dehydrogenase catalytic domain-containing protein [Actinomycetota bacterium]